MTRWIGFGSRVLMRTGVAVLALAVLGPAVAESQILVICGIYRDSYADKKANLCHGSGPGCAECVFIALATGDGVEPADSPSQRLTVASYTPRLVEKAEEAGQPLSLAVNTGLPFTPPVQSGCTAPALFDRVRASVRGRVSPPAKNRPRERLLAQVSAQ